VAVVLGRVSGDPSTTPQTPGVETVCEVSAKIRNLKDRNLNRVQASASWSKRPAKVSGIQVEDPELDDKVLVYKNRNVIVDVAFLLTLLFAFDMFTTATPTPLGGLKRAARVDDGRQPPNL
jgi:hypothetical protein